MIDFESLAQVGTVHPPADADEIQAAEAATGHRFPAEYGALLSGSNGLEPHAGLAARYAISLFPAGELAEMNTAYQVPNNLPGFLFIGLDGGGRGLFLDCAGKPGALYLCEMGAQSPDFLRPLAPNLEAWIAGGFDLGDPPPETHPERIDVYLIRTPRDGLKGLPPLLRLLDLTLPAREYRTVLGQLPYRLRHAAPWLPYSWRCAEHNEADPCLGVTEVDRPDQAVSVTPRTPPK